MKLQWERPHAQGAYYKSTLGVTLYAHLHHDRTTYAAFVTRGSTLLFDAPAYPDTLEAAQAWCEDAYADLLRAELSKLVLDVCACGAQPVAIPEGEPGHEGYFAVCERCYAAGPYHADYNAAVAGWNRGERVTDNPPAADELRGRGAAPGVGPGLG